MTGLLIIRGKRIKILRDLQGQIRGKIGRFCGIFLGKNSKFMEKSANFAGFSRKKVKIRGKIGRFRGILAEQIKFRRIFRGKFLEKLADFTGNFRGKLRQETISKKQPISPDFVLANFAKIDSIFALI